MTSNKQDAVPNPVFNGRRVDHRSDEGQGKLGEDGMLMFIVSSRKIGEEEIQTTSVVDILQKLAAYCKRIFVNSRDRMKGSMIVDLGIAMME